MESDDRFEGIEYTEKKEELSDSSHFYYIEHVFPSMRQQLVKHSLLMQCIHETNGCILKGIWCRRRERQRDMINFMGCKIALEGSDNRLTEEANQEFLNRLLWDKTFDWSIPASRRKCWNLEGTERISWTGLIVQCFYSTCRHQFCFHGNRCFAEMMSLKCSFKEINFPRCYRIF